MLIADKLKQIKRRITQAAKRSARSPDDIKLVVAGKYADTDQLLQAIKAGVSIIGENKAQDLVRKYQAIGDRVDWHFIGHLQTNKVKQVISYISLLHSLDSFRLAEILERELVKISKILPVLVEVNISKESSKHGVEPEKVIQLIEFCRQLPHLQVKGLMTMAALVNNPEDNRPHFRALRQLAQQAHLPELSMGTSQDFEVAIEEGATLVRLGRAIFT